MNDTSNDTIAAVATPAGRGGVGVIRVSGPATSGLIESLFGRVLQPRHAHFLPFKDGAGESIDSGLALFFPAPHSFTGEDVLELHGHGSPVILDLLLRRLLELGVRLARPGEFSERAFLNDKIDLAQAEAIADLIDSASEQAARSAQRSLQGEFSRRIDALLESLIELRAYTEVAIDFVDEDIDFLAQGQIAEKLDGLVGKLDGILRTARQGQILRDGFSVVIAGRPNAGKSSLLNALTGRDSAIVTDIAGTTRDVLREYIQIDGMPLHVIDTAGLRDSDNPVEREGIRRARAAIAQADRILLLSDDRETDEGDECLAELPERMPVTRIRNKIDLSGRAPGIRESGHGVEIDLSVKTGEGLELLRRHLKECAGYDAEAGQVFIARRRHLDALDRARDAILSGLTQLRLNQAPELLAEDLRQAQQALGEITGAYTTEDLLGKIFSSFCIGK
ncbi:tRNA uridine-5-carboxymethylaminomethyl(34) synthesis GTPase MnmE [Methylococcus sp. EFPC2]|uniref:tRNA uridine-5-carboxymethylaminomethyl(34) synthesis GTPase MnmE n=1 Tax=Methylococcus sp. EFPC2 TaxID=2812648 RepID=UPI001967AE9B|nr:tRNA uridine-5-carboxymethylaminomethyl(34) synthesis GTPase MnmE [Methylococcus sp. EFPC2]QSA95995.1 tRNA uridine-5-carboxymethylaminomethyl(34) synthesis GTPase MnmE [Methylococcus sp. EFPC2]